MPTQPKSPKVGRPLSVTYEQFTPVWEQLINGGRATTNAAHDMLGGGKSTIAGFRERYEQQKTSKTQAFIKSVELPEALHRTIADIKVKEIETLEQAKKELESRIDSYIHGMNEAESKLAEARVEFEDAKSNFDLEKLTLERKLAASQARNEYLEKREQSLTSQCDKLNQQYNDAKQDAAVAQKEVQVLRETIKEKT